MSVKVKYFMDYSDNFFMQRCIQLARLGKGTTSPNPLVGAVIVYNDQIIGEGFHQKYGEAHAEVNAINAVKDKELLKQSSMYVNLEPCSHYGKTPPCADLIVHHQFKRVVIGMKDPFAKVNGLGIKRIKDAGIDVSVGILQKECEELNKEFITFHKKERPYIMLKWAETEDGFIDIIRKKGNGQNINWITNETCRALVHKWRSHLSGILIGTETAISDNPKLNVRLWTGNSPLRIVMDNRLRLPNSLNIFDNSVKTLIFNSLKNDLKGNTEYVKVSFDKNILPNILRKLYERQINSIMVEGGRKTLESFIRANLYDELQIFVGNKFFKKGVRAPEIEKKEFEVINFGNSKLYFKNRNKKK